MFIKETSALFLFLLLGACGTGWQHLKVENVPYSDLFRLAAHVIDSEGFVIEESNPHTGEILSRWDYNKLIDVGRFPIRRRVEAQVNPADEGRYKVELRIEQEALWESYRTTNLEKQKGWKFYSYDKEFTRELLTRIKLKVQSFEPSDAFYEKYRRREALKDSIPEALEDRDQE